MGISGKNCTPRKLLLTCSLSPGDIVMMTAAVRDMHRCYPGRYITAVHTSCSEIWANNPYVHPKSGLDSGFKQIRCEYPLINYSNRLPYHCIHGFIQYLNKILDINIKPTVFCGDIYISDLEKSWYSQVYEITQKEMPYWIVAAGGKYDVPIKWWESRRFQEVLDHFQGKIQFVQVGDWGHHHPKLRGAIDLRGKTDLRQLIRLVYHAQGVLCPVTSLMHLAAAIETKPPLHGARPCVVIAGGREPAHWEAYPNHQFIHNNGSMPCSSRGGCWKNRHKALGDGDRRDSLASRCLNVSNDLPRCMDLITAEDVIRRIEYYFQGGALRYLRPKEYMAAQEAVVRTRVNSFDEQPLSLPSTRSALEQKIVSLSEYPEKSKGRGIVICGGGKYFSHAWVCINMLRSMGCELPVELWHLGTKEMPRKLRELVASLKVKCVDAQLVRRQNPVRILRGWELKPYSILHSSFKEVLLLDADNVPIRNPEYLFMTQPFIQTGAVFWPDYGRSKSANPIWRSFGLKVPAIPEFESGQILVDKSRCWKALGLTMWINENSDFFYQYLHGDKDTFHLAFAKLQTPFVQVKTPIESLDGVMCQHDFEGRRVFQHRNSHKWKVNGSNRAVRGFRFETQCFHFLRELNRKFPNLGSYWLLITLMAKLGLALC